MFHRTCSYSFLCFSLSNRESQLKNCPTQTNILCNGSRRFVAGCHPIDISEFAHGLNSTQNFDGPLIKRYNPPIKNNPVLKRFYLTTRCIILLKKRGAKLRMELYFSQYCLEVFHLQLRPHPFCEHGEHVSLVCAPAARRSSAEAKYHTSTYYHDYNGLSTNLGILMENDLNERFPEKFFYNKLPCSFRNWYSSAPSISGCCSR